MGIGHGRPRSPLWLDVLHATRTDSHYKPMLISTRREHLPVLGLLSSAALEGGACRRSPRVLLTRGLYHRPAPLANVELGLRPTRLEYRQSLDLRARPFVIVLLWPASQAATDCDLALARGARAFTPQEASVRLPTASAWLQHGAGLQAPSSAAQLALAGGLVRPRLRAVHASVVGVAPALALQAQTVGVAAARTLRQRAVVALPAALAKADGCGRRGASR